MLIHKTAIVHPDAELAPGVEIGAYSIIGKNVRIGTETKIGSHVVVEENTEIGSGVKISPHAVIGGDPQDLKWKGQNTYCAIGDDTVIREFVTIHRGSVEGNVTRVGGKCFLMSNVHIAHDCQIGSDVTMANLATLGGHCRVDDGAVLGGMCVAHQFVHIGKYAMIGGTAGLMQDVPPFMMAFGTAPAKIVNINHIGIRRAGYSREDRANLRFCFRLLYRNGLSFKEALDKIDSEFEDGPPVELVKFFRESRRGTCKPVSRVTYMEAVVHEGERFRTGQSGFYDELTTSLPAT
jgi:UDP-N-acetylglucosamine acyltransferase